MHSKTIAERVRDERVQKNVVLVGNFVVVRKAKSLYLLYLGSII